MSKLTDLQKIEIVEKYLTGNYNCCQLAEEYNLKQSSVYNLLKRRGVKFRNRADIRRKYTINQNYFDSIDAEEKAYFLGFLYADGCVYNKNDKYHSIRLYLQESDKEILERFSVNINSNKPLDFISNKNKKDGYIRKAQYGLSLTSKRLCESLIKLGCVPRKSLILKFPTLEQVPEHLIRHFIRGMWDGDGSFSYWTVKSNGSVNIDVSIVGTNNICSSIKDILEKQLLDSQIFSIKNKPVYRLKIKGQENMHKFMVWLYSDATIYLQRKYEKCREIETILMNKERLTIVPFFGMEEL